MKCRICGRECDGDFCEDCVWMLDYLHDRYTLAEQSKIFTYSPGSKAVEEISEKMANKLFAAYGAEALNDVNTGNVQ